MLRSGTRTDRFVTFQRRSASFQAKTFLFQ